MSALDEAREMLGRMGDIAWAQTYALIAIAEQLQLANLIAMETAEWETGIRFKRDMHALADIDRDDQS